MVTVCPGLMGAVWTNCRVEGERCSHDPAMAGETVGRGLDGASAWLRATRIAAEESTVVVSAGVAATTAIVLGGTVEGVEGAVFDDPELRTMPPTPSAATTSRTRPPPMTHGALEADFDAWDPAMGSIYLRSG